MCARARAEPIIGFTKTIYDVTEPKRDNDGREEATVTVLVARHGDTSKQSIVRVYTKDGNAESGKDYNPLSTGEWEVDTLFTHVC